MVEINKTQNSITLEFNDEVGNGHNFWLALIGNNPYK